MTKLSTRLIATGLAMATICLGLTTVPAGAGTITACISPGGDIKNIAVGDEPSKECSKNDTLIVFESAHQASSCPCNIRGMATWAGWTGPSCFEAGAQVNLTSTDDDLPLVIVIFANGNTICETHNDLIRVDSFNDLTEEQAIDCFSDVDALAKSLGLETGCSPVNF